MARLTSFKDVVENLFYDDIFSALSEYIEDNPGRLDINSHSVGRPDEAVLVDMAVRFVTITADVEGSKILFDVVVSAEIEISETVRRNRETDGAGQWFKVSCSAELDDGIQAFAIKSVDVYNKYRDSKKRQLSEYLVPIIKAEQLDAIADEFLMRYYPEALCEPMPIEVREIANRMGLDVQEVHITKTCTVFGQVCFSDSEIQYYDEDLCKYKSLKIKRGTILVDPNVYFMRNVGSMNNTIIHECVHWYLHKKFFELEKLYNDEARFIRCQVREDVKSEVKRSPLDWMEWQANALAPRILMPKTQTRQKVEELIEKNKRVLKSDDVATLMESVVYELSEFFEVSKQAAKIRMLDLGYTEVMGVYTYIDDHYIANYAFEKAALKNKQTFTIGIQDALVEYAINKEFKQMLDSGNYVYVDAHFCINNSKYIRQDANGYVEMTDYARQHIDECCLVFDIATRKNDRYGAKYYRECVLFRDALSDTISEAKYSDSLHNKETEERAIELARIGEDATRIANIARKLPTTFADTLIAHMERLKCSVEVLADRALIAAKTIQRMRNDIKYQSKIETVVAVCIGLQLHPILSVDLLTKAGFVLKSYEPEHIIYHLLLNTKYKSSIYECNEILRTNKCKPLSKEE